MKKPVQIFPTQMNTYSAFCRERAAYFIGRPDWAMANRIAVSEREAVEIVQNLPEALLNVIKEHYGLVEVEKVAESIVENVKEVESIVIAPDGEVSINDTDDDMDIEKMNLTQLRQLAKQLDIPSYSRLNTTDLRKKINELVESEE